MSKAFHMKLLDDSNNKIFSERPSEFYRFILVPSKMEFYSCFIFYREFWLSKTFNNAGNPNEAILFPRIFFPENTPKWLLIFFKLKSGTKYISADTWIFFIRAVYSR